MDLSWQIWVTLAVIFVIVEITTPEFYAMFFAAGALVAAVLAWLGLPASIQIAVAGAIAMLSLFLAKPLATRLVKKTDFKAGAEGLIGKKGKITKGFSGDGEGLVVVEGEEWRAKTTQEAVLSEGETIQVLKIDSTKLIVGKLVEDAKQ